MNKTLPKNLQAIIFDMDGTLVDNIPFHRKAWITFLKRHGIILAPEDFIKQDHGNIYDMIRHFFGQEVSDRKVIDLGQERERIYIDLYRHNIKEVQGLTGFLTKASKMNIISSLASMSDAPIIDLVLDALKIRDFFHSITHGLEIHRGKPNPEIYHLALKKLALKNSECMVIEDSIGGITSAREAGLEVIGITTSLTENELIAHGCISTISNFHDLIL